MCVACDKNIPKTRFLEIKDCDKITILSGVRSVKGIFIDNCPNLIRIYNISPLESLYCTNCERLKETCLLFTEENHQEVITSAGFEELDRDEML